MCQVADKQQLKVLLDLYDMNPNTNTPIDWHTRLVLVISSELNLSSTSQKPNEKAKIQTHQIKCQSNHNPSTKPSQSNQVSGK